MNVRSGTRFMINESDKDSRFDSGVSVSADGVELRSLVDVSLVVDVIKEGHDNLVPSREAAIGLHGDQVSQPGDVLDLLLLELEIRVEATVMELLLECH